MLPSSLSIKRTFSSALAAPFLANLAVYLFKSLLLTLKVVNGILPTSWQPAQGALSLRSLSVHVTSAEGRTDARCNQRKPDKMSEVSRTAYTVLHNHGFLAVSCIRSRRRRGGPALLLSPILPAPDLAPVCPVERVGSQLNAFTSGQELVQSAGLGAVHGRVNWLASVHSAGGRTGATMDCT